MLHPCVPVQTRMFLVLWRMLKESASRAGGECLEEVALDSRTAMRRTDSTLQAAREAEYA